MDRTVEHARTGQGGARVREVMNRPVVAVTADTDFTTLAATLCAYRHGALPVVAEDGLVLGVVSAPDLLAEYVRPPDAPAQGGSSGLRARDVMTAPAVTVEERATVVEAVQRAVGHGVHRLPVVNHLGRLVGVVSLTDLLRALHRDDEALRARALALALTPGSGVVPDSLRIRCEHGHVTLSGRTRARSDAAALCARVRRLHGVSGLTDHLSWDTDDTPAA